MGVGQSATRLWLFGGSRGGERATPALQGVADADWRS